eukprot:UN10029
MELVFKIERFVYFLRKPPEPKIMEIEILCLSGVYPHKSTKGILERKPCLKHTSRQCFVCWRDKICPNPQT